MKLTKTFSSTFANISGQQIVVPGNDYKNQSGFSFIELLIAVSLISLAFLLAGATISVLTTSREIVERKRDAENLAMQVVTKLKAAQKETVAAGGAFTVDSATGQPARNDSGEVTLNCTADYCDRVIEYPAEHLGESPRQEVIGWNDSLPDGTTLKFIRSWTLTDEDTVRNWRRITVALFVPESNVPTSITVTGGVIK